MQTNQNTIKNTESIMKTLEQTHNDTTLKQLNLKASRQVLNRLEAFSEECEGCQMLLEGYYDDLKALAQKDSLDRLDVKLFRKMHQNAVNHLTKEHKLVTENYYMSLYLPLGLMFGVIFGLLFFNNMSGGFALFTGVGLSVGVAIGINLDQNAKKKDRVI